MYLGFLDYHYCNHNLVTLRVAAQSKNYSCPERCFIRDRKPVRVHSFRSKQTAPDSCRKLATTVKYPTLVQVSFALPSTVTSSHVIF